MILCVDILGLTFWGWHFGLTFWVDIFWVDIFSWHQKLLTFFLTANDFKIYSEARQCLIIHWRQMDIKIWWSDAKNIIWFKTVYDNTLIDMSDVEWILQSLLVGRKKYDLRQDSVWLSVHPLTCPSLDEVVKVWLSDAKSIIWSKQSMITHTLAYLTLNSC